MRNFFAANLSVLFALATTLSAAEPAKTPPLLSQITLPATADSNRPKRFLTVLDGVQSAIQQNLDVSIQRLNPAISAADVQAAEGIFDINWVTALSESENLRPPGFSSTSFTPIAPANTRTYSYQQNLTGLSPIGTEYTLGFNGSRQQSSLFTSPAGPQWTMFMGATVTQPLLKGFGWDVNTAQIRIARKTQDISYQQFVQLVMQTVSNVKQAYYDLHYAIENVKVKELSVELAKRFLEESRKRMEVGTMARLDVVQAEAELSQREGDLIDAIRQWNESEVTYKQLISRDMLSIREVMLVPVDRPSIVAMPLDALDSIRQGLDNRPEYLQSKLQLESNHIHLKYYKNSLLPQVDLAASYGYNAINQAGLDQDFSQLSKNFDSVHDREFPAWSAGLTITVPLGNTTARGNYRHWKLAVEQALLSLKKTEQNIMVGVELAVIQARAKAKLIASSQATTRLRQESYAAEVEKLKAGTSTTYTVLQMQRDLNDARVTELRAIADYNKALVALSNQEGTILKRSGVTVEPDTKK
ncbi:MAG: TolC family protein [Verrucomicrobia bacterium]|nr:TolC family protein [Verrucomicrobiota bacterium]